MLTCVLFVRQDRRVTSSENVLDSGVEVVFRSSHILSKARLSDLSFVELELDRNTSLATEPFDPSGSCGA